MAKDYWNELPRRARTSARERFNYIMNKIEGGSTSTETKKDS